MNVLTLTSPLGLFFTVAAVSSLKPPCKPPGPLGLYLLPISYRGVEVQRMCRNLAAWELYDLGHPISLLKLTCPTCRTRMIQVPYLMGW